MLVHSRRSRRMSKWSDFLLIGTECERERERESETESERDRKRDRKRKREIGREQTGESKRGREREHY